MLAWPRSMISGEVPDLSSLEQTNIALMTVMTAFWFSCVGACLGSFLNVVVYRLPRGITLVRKKSSCPSCNQPIEMRDNIPIFG
jgi:Bacterial Peptidase A24 N-terminal domain